jgi:hypothetical protein
MDQKLILRSRIETIQVSAVPSAGPLAPAMQPSKWFHRADSEDVAERRQFVDGALRRMRELLSKKHFPY